MLRRNCTASAVAALAVLAAACSSERVAGTGTNVQACGASSDVVGSFDMIASELASPLAEPAGPTVARAAAAAVAIAPLNGAVVSFPGPSAQLNDTSARYLVVPQFAVQAGTPDSTRFTLTVGTGAAAVAASLVEQPARPSAQSMFDLKLRQIESKLPLETRLDPTGRVARTAGIAAAPDSVRSFYVLGSITGNCFVQTQARLRYTGARVYVYEDTGVQDTFSTTEYADFGKLFD
ncbi:MAG TPA: hypothetical protein VHM30_06700, partial [Gemmatimonadaceae bacterium]|nr:hypothetical protein [Gemmatimonadaceae bacterium]